jgi:uncharacterized membrane protein (UPF0127 family)
MPISAAPATKSVLKLLAAHSRILIVLVLLLLVTMLAARHPLAAECSEIYRKDTIITTPMKQDIAVQIASDPASQEKGLGGRACIGSYSGMLFSFDKPGNYPFWMKGMRFPIDILWLSADRQVVTVQSGVDPNTFPKSFSSDAPAQYVLELGAGQAAKLGITEGTALNF